jgi:hypothetical protein
VNRLKTNEYLTVKYNQSLFAQKVLYRLFLVLHIMDSNRESDEEMYNTTAKVMNKCLIRRRTSQMIIAIIVLSPDSGEKDPLFGLDTHYILQNYTTYFRFSRINSFYCCWNTHPLGD